MVKQFAFAAALAITAASEASAHSEGHGSIEPAQALVVAVGAVDYFTRETIDRDWSPLAESWAQLPSTSAKILAVVDGDYVVAVTNPEDGRIFYLLVTFDGTVVDANFTGTFPYVYDAQNPETTTTD